MSLTRDFVANTTHHKVAVAETLEEFRVHILHRALAPAVHLPVTLHYLEDI